MKNIENINKVKFSEILYVHLVKPYRFTSLIYFTFPEQLNSLKNSSQSVNTLHLSNHTKVDHFIQFYHYHFFKTNFLVAL